MVFKSKSAPIEPLNADARAWLAIFTPDCAHARRGFLAALAAMAIGAGALAAAIQGDSRSAGGSSSPYADLKTKTVYTPHIASIVMSEEAADANAARRGDLAPPLAPAHLAAPRQKPPGSAPAAPPRETPPAETAPGEATPSMSVSRSPKLVSLDGSLRASAAAAPPPVFFTADLKRRAPAQPLAVALSGDIPAERRRRTISLRRGENFVDALARAGVRAGDRNAAAYELGKHLNLRRLQPNQEFELVTAAPPQTLFQHAAFSGPATDQLLSLTTKTAPHERLRLLHKEGDFIAQTTETAPTVRLASLEGRIDGSLFVSAKAKGAPSDVIAKLANIFAYDVDFQRDIFQGDEYQAVFELLYDDQGAVVGGGEILFARLNWRGRNRQKAYYRFATPDGRADYYDGDGQSAKRLLMKTPIDGARLSSGFGTRRHPVLGYRKAHKGVDFAAPRGTPIYAAGDGVVERADRYGSFGNYIRIRHKNGYKTAYAHLHRFRKGLRKGKRVRQGDIIGYVGTTGRSTGPHLHYEVHRNGRAVNPQRLKISLSEKLSGARRLAFLAERGEIDALLGGQDPERWAAHNDRAPALRRPKLKPKANRHASLQGGSTNDAPRP